MTKKSNPKSGSTKIRRDPFFERGEGGRLAFFWRSSTSGVFRNKRPNEKREQHFVVSERRRSVPRWYIALVTCASGEIEE